MSTLQNKTVVITGASSGIGSYIAEEVAANGGTPILIARSKEKLITVASTIKTKFSIESPIFIADVSNKEEVKALFDEIYQRYSIVDILVNNAGFGVFETCVEVTEELFEQMMNVNFLGTVYCTKQVLPSMIKGQQGHIINIASQAGKVGTPKSTAYAASKHAVLGFSNSLRLELKEHHIHVTSVNPGPVRTPFHTLADQSGEYVKKISKYILEPKAVAEKVIQVMHHPKREVNLPRWMNWGSLFYTLFPQTMDQISLKFLNKK